MNTESKIKMLSKSDSIFSNNKSIKEYQEVISNINEQLKDNSSEYIMVQKVFLFKKSDFVNAKITIKDN